MKTNTTIIGLVVPANGFCDCADCQRRERAKEKLKKSLDEGAGWTEIGGLQGSES
jgi:hypothetical protein